MSDDLRCCSCSASAAFTETRSYELKNVAARGCCPQLLYTIIYHLLFNAINSAVHTSMRPLYLLLDSVLYNVQYMHLCRVLMSDDWIFALWGQKTRAAQFATIGFKSFVHVLSSPFRVSRTRTVFVRWRSNPIRANRSAATSVVATSKTADRWPAETNATAMHFIILYNVHYIKFHSLYDSTFVL